jgi:hypothetical protein
MSGLLHELRSIDAPHGVDSLARRVVPAIAIGGLIVTAVLVSEARWWAILVLVPTALACFVAERLDLT